MKIGLLALALVAALTAFRLGARETALLGPRPPAASGPTAAPAPEVPDGVGNVDELTPAMRRSVERAIAQARSEGVELRVTSGWRSEEHQRRLFRDAVRKYGSPAAARKWVLPPGESAHVRGEAVDVGPASGADWLARNGERFGLCRRYANEPWHFERLAGAIGSTCPPLEPHP